MAESSEARREDDDDRSRLPEAYRNATTYLDSLRFHHTLTFTPTSSTEPVTVSYALVGSVDVADSRVIVWVNGMGHHRIAAAMFDAVARTHGVRVLTIDRPASGRSTTTTTTTEGTRYRDRVRVVTEACHRVLAHERLDDRGFELWTHSNGIVYGLDLVLSSSSSSSRGAPRCERWVMTSPWVVPSLSGHVALRCAQRFVPQLWTERLGTVAESVQRVVGTVGTSVGWSRAFVAGSSQPDAARAREAIDAFEAREASKPVDERTFGPRYYPQDLVDRAMRLALADGLDGIGIEAVMSLRGRGVRWEYTSRNEDEDEVGDAELYSVGFERLKDAVAPGGRFTMSVWSAGSDGMIPAKGRAWLRALLVDRLELVPASEWREVPSAGHDEILARQVVIDDILGRARVPPSP
ncbi:hypothetical protein JCM11491_002869 [Sporobolomyces phaffii]